MFRQKWVILTVLAIPTVIVLVQTLGSRTLYKSTATVLLRRGQRESAIVPYVTVLPWEEQVSSEEQTATSTVVVTKAQDDLGNTVVAWHSWEGVVDQVTLTSWIQDAQSYYDECT